MEQRKLHSNHYGFSATRIEKLDASEYTLVTIAADRSGSVSSFAPAIESCMANVMRACRYSPRADNLLLRVVTFGSRLSEVHGFKPIGSCAAQDYDGCITPSGTTALYDAGENAIEATRSYAETLTERGYDVNAITFVITDGMDNASAASAQQLADEVLRSLESESLTSMNTILIGVGVSNPDVSKYLSQLKKAAGFSQYVELGNATEHTLAGLADFVSRSIFATSQALGQGSGKVTLRF